MDLSLTQWIGLIAVAALVIQGAWAGYHRGPIRQLAGVLALLVSALVGWLTGPLLSPLLLADTIVPWMFRDAAAGLLVALVTWLITLAWLWRAGRRPKGATEAESPVLGAMVGCWTGLLDVALLLLALTAWAGLNEAMLRPEDAARHWASRARDELAGLPGAQGLRGFSPWPENWVRISRKAQQVLGHPEASRRLMEQDAVRALAAHPSFYTAWGDPEVKHLARQGRLIDVLEHPKVRPLLNDEAFQRQLRETDLEDILDKALANKKAR